MDEGLPSKAVALVLGSVLRDLDVGGFKYPAAENCTIDFVSLDNRRDVAMRAFEHAGS